MKLTTDMKTVLRHLLDYGYTYLAKDPGNNIVYAYTAKPHLEENFYTLSDQEMARGHRELIMTSDGIEMFINDHDIDELYEIDTETLGCFDVDAAHPVEIESLL